MECGRWVLQAAAKSGILVGRYYKHVAFLFLQDITPTNEA
jgi:hypothetical protein